MRKSILALITTIGLCPISLWAQVSLSAHTAVTSTTDSDHGMSSLTMTDADCDVLTPSGACTVPSGDGPYRGTFIVTSSVPLTATRNIIVPLSSGRAVYVKNASSGGQQLCVKGSTGSAACIASGQTGIAVSDGANYNLISGGGSSGTSSLGLVVADGSTYATIQAAYTAACATAPNLNVYVPANSTVTDFAYSSPNYMVSTCTSQVTDGRTGITYGSRGNNLFQAQTPRKDYYPREAMLKSHWIDLINNGVNAPVIGIPSTVQWTVGLLGDSVSGFATQYNLTQKHLGLGLAGYFQTASHVGTANNEQFFGLPQTSLNLTSGTSGTSTSAVNGTPDPTTINGSSLTLGSSSSTGTLTMYLSAAQQGTDQRFRNMQQAAFWYLCDGRAATVSIQTSPDGVNYYNETVSGSQPNTCAATGGIVAVGVAGVGSGSGCSTLTLGATGGTGFSGTAFPNALGQIERVVVNAQGSGYNPYTSAITITGGSCTSNPTWGNLLTSNISIQQAVVTHDGIAVARITSAGDAVKLIGWGMYNPNATGMVLVDQGFGGSSIDSLFAAPNSYYAPWYNNLPVPDTVYVQALDNTEEAGQLLGYWFGQIYTRYSTLHTAKAATFGTQSACNAAGYGWVSSCQAYTPDTLWMSTYPAGNTTNVSAGRDGDLSVMQQINTINRGGGNATYVDLSYTTGINSADMVNRLMFSTSDPNVHQTGAGRILMNSNVQQINAVPPQDMYATQTLNGLRVGQGSATNPGLQFVQTGNAGIYYNTAAHQPATNGGLYAEGPMTSIPGTYGAPTTYIPATGATSATYMICAGFGGNLNPIGCTATVSITTGPTTLSTTNFVQLCLARPIVGANAYYLIRTSGYAGPSVVYSTSSFTNNTTPPCMTDTGQAGSTYTAANWNPTGFLRINSPNTPNDFRQFGAIRTADGLFDINIGEGLQGGTWGGLGLKVVDPANSNNYCRHSMAANGWSLSLSCGGSYANFPAQFNTAVQIQTPVTNRPNLDVLPTALLTGTIPTSRFAPTSAPGTCPSGGCNVLFDVNSGYAGYNAIFSTSGGRKFAVHATNGLEFFGNPTFVTGVQGNGVNLLTTGGTSPTMVAGAAAGTSPSCTTITGGNTSGVITCTTGTGTITGTLATITFNGTLALTPNGCHLQARDATTAPVATSIYTTAPSSTTWTIGVGSALAASTTYTWAYSCL